MSIICSLKKIISRSNIKKINPISKQIHFIDSWKYLPLNLDSMLMSILIINAK